MKTSNKLLFSAASAAILAMAVFMISVKKHVNIIEGNGKIVGNNVKTEVVQSINFEGKTLNLNHNFIYTLDAYKNELIVNAESNLQPYVNKEESDGRVEIDIDKNKTYEVNLPIEVAIGVKDKNDLNIKIDDYGKLVSHGVIQCNTLTLRCEDSSKTDIDIDCHKLVLIIENRAEVTIRGQAEDILFISEDNGRLYGHELYVGKATVEMENEAFAELNIFNSISGVITDRARLSHNSSTKEVKVTLTELGKLNGIEE